MPDEKNTPDQGEKTSKGKMLLGILVILCAVGGVALLFAAGQDELIPQIEGYGGNQNPFVGIPNLVMGVGSIVLLLISGSTLLGISAIGFAIWKKYERIKAKFGRQKLGRWASLASAAILALLLLRWIGGEIVDQWTHATMDEQIAETVEAIRGGSIANYAGIELGWADSADRRWGADLERGPGSYYELVSYKGKGILAFLKSLNGTARQVEYAVRLSHDGYYGKVWSVTCKVTITDFEKCLRLTRKRSRNGVDDCCTGLPPKGAIYLRPRGTANADGTWGDHAYEYEFRGEQFALTVIDTEEKAVKLLGEPNCAVNPVTIDGGSRRLCYGSSGIARLSFTFSDGRLETVAIYQSSDEIQDT